jgi:cardiolipin synthase
MKMNNENERTIQKRDGETANKIDLSQNLAPENLPEEAFSRIADAQLLRGNYVRLLKDARENYPAWLDAIKSAGKFIHFESYIIHEDAQGKIFADALIEKAKEGVNVRLIYDWMGGFGKTSRKYWNNLRENGIEVRCYNPFSFARPLGWISRDHRKTLVVDEEIAFITGLCVGQMWIGDEAKNVEAWRDTGVELRGKSVAEVARAFADVWGDIGKPLPKNEIANVYELKDEGDMNLRVVATKPGNAKTYRLDQMIGALAKKTLWLTDAYFAGTSTYIETLRSAAMDGVDVRLLVPTATDIPVMSAISRSGYRGLLEAGVKIYEWNGSMLHAKTAVIDGYWSRVGSTNLNIASWLSNCEIDAVIEDANFGAEMQKMYLADLENATEICLNEKKKASSTKPRTKKGKLTSSGSTAQFAPSVIAVGNALGSSISKITQRPLGTMEAKISLTSGFLLLIVGIIGIFFPRILAIPIGLILVWLAVSLFINSYQLYKQAKADENQPKSKINKQEKLS